MRPGQNHRFNLCTALLCGAEGLLLPWSLCRHRFLSLRGHQQTSWSKSMSVWEPRCSLIQEQSHHGKTVHLCFLSSFCLDTDSTGSFQHFYTVQYFGLEVQHLLEAEWSTPKQIQELPPARVLCHILLLLLSAASPFSPCGIGACLHLRDINFRDLDLQKFHFCLPEAQFLLCFCFFFPSPASSLQG